MLQEQLASLDDMAAQLKTTPSSVAGKLSQFMQEAKLQEKELVRLKQKIAAQSGNAMLAEVQKINDVNLLVKRVDNVDGQGLRAMLDQLKSSMDSAVIVLVAVSEDKMSVVAGVSKNILGKVPTAAMLVQYLCGKGGGRDDMAQGGGLVPEDLDKKMSHISKMVAEHRHK